MKNAHVEEQNYVCARCGKPSGPNLFIFLTDGSKYYLCVKHYKLRDTAMRKKHRDSIRLDKN